MPPTTTEPNIIEMKGRIAKRAGERAVVNTSAAKLKPQIVTPSRKIWIDLENSPHVPFFKPIIEELEQRGHTVTVTARDCFQVCELADLFHMQYKRIGKHYGKNGVAKIAGLGVRVLQMTPGVLRDKPDLSMSHGSRSQVMLSRLLGIPNLTIFDYEHSTWLPFFKPEWVMAPELISEATICRKGIRKEGVMHYSGIKEDVYAPSFKPNPGIKQELGINPEHLVVTIRPPATEAHYHNPEAEGLLTAVFELLGAIPESRIILVPRTPKQGQDLKAQFPAMFENKQAIIPERVMDGLDLIWFSDLVISGGGTMNREAAALGVPVYSIFRGTIGAVDHYLEEQGRLTLLTSVADVKTKLKTVRRTKVSQRSQIVPSQALDDIVNNILHILNVESSKRGARRTNA